MHELYCFQKGKKTKQNWKWEQHLSHCWRAAKKQTRKNSKQAKKSGNNNTKQNDHNPIVCFDCVVRLSISMFCIDYATWRDNMLIDLIASFKSDSFIKLFAWRFAYQPFYATIAKNAKKNSNNKENNRILKTIHVIYVISL